MLRRVPALPPIAPRSRRATVTVMPAILTPLPDSPVRIVQPQAFGFFCPAGGLIPGVPGLPGTVLNRLFNFTRTVQRLRAGATSLFPLRLRPLAVARRRSLHSLPLDVRIVVV